MLFNVLCVFLTFVCISSKKTYYIVPNVKKSHVECTKPLPCNISTAISQIKENKEKNPTLIFLDGTYDYSDQKMIEFPIVFSLLFQNEGNVFFSSSPKEPLFYLEDFDVITLDGFNFINFKRSFFDSFSGNETSKREILLKNVNISKSYSFFNNKENSVYLFNVLNVTNLLYDDNYHAFSLALSKTETVCNFEKCVFSNNQNQNGALFMTTEFELKVYFTKVTFKNNKNSDESPFDPIAIVQAIRAVETISIAVYCDHAVFMDQLGGNFDISVYNGNILFSAKNSNFTNNHAYDFGASVSLSSSVNQNGNLKIVVDNCRFVRNSAHRSGSAIDARSAVVNFNISNSFFDSGSSLDGTSIFVQCWNSTGILHRNIFTQNKGFLGIVYVGLVFLKDLNFLDAIYADVHSSDNEFIENYVSGSIFIVTQDLNFTSSHDRFVRNLSPDRMGYGINIRNSGKTFVIIDGSRFLNNNSTDTANGGVYFNVAEFMRQEKDFYLEIIDTEFRDNILQSTAGSEILIEFTDVSIKENRLLFNFENNVHDCLFGDKKACKCMDDPSLVERYISVSNSNFSNIFSPNLVSMNIDNCTISMKNNRFERNKKSFINGNLLTITTHKTYLSGNKWIDNDGDNYISSNSLDQARIELSNEKLYNCETKWVLSSGSIEITDITYRILKENNIYENYNAIQETVLFGISEYNSINVKNVSCKSFVGIISVGEGLKNYKTNNAKFLGSYSGVKVVINGNTNVEMDSVSFDNGGCVTLHNFHKFNAFNSTFKNLKNPRGGAFFVNFGNYSKQFFLNNVDIVKSSATNGGGIYFIGDNEIGNEVILNNIHMVGCTAVLGSGIFFAQRNLTNLKIINSILSNDHQNEFYFLQSKHTYQIKILKPEDFYKKILEEIFVNTNYTKENAVISPSSFVSKEKKPIECKFVDLNFYEYQCKFRVDLVSLIPKNPQRILPIGFDVFMHPEIRFPEEKRCNYNDGFLNYVLDFQNQTFPKKTTFKTQFRSYFSDDQVNDTLNFDSSYPIFNITKTVTLQPCNLPSHIRSIMGKPLCVPGSPDMTRYTIIIIVLSSILLSVVVCVVVGCFLLFRQSLQPIFKNADEKSLENDKIQTEERILLKSGPTSAKPKSKNLNIFGSLLGCVMNMLRCFCCSVSRKRDAYTNIDTIKSTKEDSNINTDPREIIFQNIDF